MPHSNFEDTLSSIASSQNLQQRPKSRFAARNTSMSSSSRGDITQHHTISNDSFDTHNSFDPDNTDEGCTMSTDLERQRRKRKEAQRAADLKLRDTAKKYNRWSPRKETQDIEQDMQNMFFPDFTGGSSQINGTNNSSQLASKLANLDQDNTPCRIPKSKSERLTSASKNNSRFNTKLSTENTQPANTPKRVVKNIFDDHEFSLDLSHPVHNKENILPRQRPHIPASPKHESFAQTEHNERKVLAELESLIKDNPPNSSTRPSRFAKAAASPTFTMSTTVNGSFAIPEVQNITKLVDNTSASLPKKIEILEQPSEPMGTEEVDIYRSIDELQQQVAMLLNERRERDSIISNLQNERRERDSIITTLQNERRERESVIATLQNERRERDSVIATLQNEPRERESMIATLQKERKDQDSMVLTLRAQNQHLAATVHQVQADAQTQLNENDDLKNNIENIAKQRDMILARYKNLVERFDTLQHSANAETSQPKEQQTLEKTPSQPQKNSETLNNDNELQDEDEDDDGEDDADVTMRPTMDPRLALQKIMENVQNQIEQLGAQHTAKAAELRALDKSKNLRLRRSLAEALKVLVDQISSHSDFLYRLKDVSYGFQ